MSWVCFRLRHTSWYFVYDTTVELCLDQRRQPGVISSSLCSTTEYCKHNSSNDLLVLHHLPLPVHANVSAYSCSLPIFYLKHVVQVNTLHTVCNSCVIHCDGQCQHPCKALCRIKLVFLFHICHNNVQVLFVGHVLLQLSGEGNAKKYQHWVNVIHKCRFCLFSTFL